MTKWLGECCRDIVADDTRKRYQPKTGRLRPQKCSRCDKPGHNVRRCKRFADIRIEDYAAARMEAA